MPTFKDAKVGAAITVKVTPRARRNEVQGLMEDGTVKINIAAAPEDGAANRALVAYLAEILDIEPSQIDILGGLSSERKLVSLVGVSPAQVEVTVNRLAAERTEKKRAARKPASKPKRPAKRKKPE